jgi:hypothetical protein
MIFRSDSLLARIAERLRSQPSLMQSLASDW